MTPTLRAEVIASVPAVTIEAGGSAPSALRELQLVELEILREFVRLCLANGLRYYLAYGTLLGAVRHRGFIPWDDDIDVAMPREDYERFAAICRAGLPGALRWQSYATESEYPVWFGKLIREDTVLRQAMSEHLPISQSVFIDVFPLDGLAGRRLEVLVQRGIVRLSRLRLGVALKRTPLNRFLVQSTRIVPHRVVVALVDAMAGRYPSRRATRWLCGGGPYGHARQSFPSHWFGTGTELVFEDMVVVGPACWDEILTQLYGDYRTPPPKSSQVSHHEVTEVRLAPGHPTGDGGT